MCKKSKSCTLLGDESRAWSKTVPLPPPDWFDGQLLLFCDAAEKAANGERDKAIQILKTTKSDDMREWFDEHGQASGGHRYRRWPVYAPKGEELDPIKSLTARIANGVFNRDSYTCRYCGLRVIAKEVLEAFKRAVDAPQDRDVAASHFFTSTGKGSTNALQHGVVHAFKIVADHVIPHRCGGRTDLANLVTSCPGCNYGKAHYTIEQLGLDDPRDRPPAKSEWNGLTSLVDGLKSHELRA